MGSGNRIEKRVMWRGTEKLIAQDGFIRDVVEENILECFQQDEAEMVLKYCEFGQGFFNVAELISKIHGNIYNKCFFMDEETGEPHWISDEKFADWYIEQIARLAVERRKTWKEHFWAGWNISRECRRALNKLSLIDEQILRLSEGVNGEKNSTTEIAALPEFSCPEEYIYYVTRHNEMLLQDVREELEQFTFSDCVRSERNQNR